MGVKALIVAGCLLNLVSGYERKLSEYSESLVNAGHDIRCVS